MQAAFESGGLSRREFMQGLMAAGLTVSGATVILGSARDVKAMTPKRGGRLRYAWNLHGPNDTLDPALIGGGLDYVRARSYYNNLVQFNDDLSLRPELAEEWDVSTDGLEWTFKLRKDVQFHDGAPFTADDVVYTLNRHMGEDSVSRVTEMVSFVSEWKKVDKHTVKAVLASPNSDLPAILGTFHFKIVQNGAEGEYFNQPNGTGPFKPVEFSPGVRALGVRNDNYFRGEVWLDEIETFGITDNVARVNALVSGDVDIIGGVDPKAIKQIEESDIAEMWSVPSGTYNGIVLSLDREPGNNPDFVWALKYLVNRERVVKSILKGQGLVGNDHPIGPPVRGGALRGASSARVRPRQGEVPPREVRNQGDDGGSRRCPARSHRHLPAAAARCREDRPEVQRQASADGWLLGQHLDGATRVRDGMVHASDREHDVLHRLCIGGALERIALEERALRPVARGDSGGAGPGAAA